MPVVQPEHPHRRLLVHAGAGGLSCRAQVPAPGTHGDVDETLPDIVEHGLHGCAGHPARAAVHQNDRCGSGRVAVARSLFVHGAVVMQIGSRDEDVHVLVVPAQNIRGVVHKAQGIVCTVLAAFPLVLILRPVQGHVVPVPVRQHNARPGRRTACPRVLHRHLMQIVHHIILSLQNVKTLV